MGTTTSSKQLVVATVNYSGILHSPFQFYSEQSWKEQEEVSKCFKQLLQQYSNHNLKNFKWGLGNVDKKLQKERYAPVYRPTAGVQDKKLLNQKQFRRKWQEQFAKLKPTLDFQVTHEELANTQNFDLLCYRAFIYYLYGVKNLDQAALLDNQKYQKFMKRYFQKSFLNQEKKIELTFKAMVHEEVDVFLFQESSKLFQNMLSHRDEFLFFKSQAGNSLVVLKKEKFRKVHNPHKALSYLPQQFVKGLNWNQDSAICMADNFIFISVHLSSKKDKNPEQIKKMVADIQKLHEIYPMCQIIVGGDLNSYLDPAHGPKGMQVYPNSPQIITTMKKRTWLQPQVHKADEMVSQCKDSLISTLPLVKSRVVSIRGESYKNIKFIPNHQHPCDHFVVTANVVAKY